MEDELPQGLVHCKLILYDWKYKQHQDNHCQKSVPPTQGSNNPIEPEIHEMFATHTRVSVAKKAESTNAI